MKFRRHQGSTIEWGSWVGWLGTLRQRLRDMGAGTRRLLISGVTLVTAFLAGYALAALVLFPAPIFARSEAVPRVLGLTLDNATRSLVEAGLVASDTVLVSHPTGARGTIVWQDPPPGVAVPQGTGVTLSVSRGPQPIPVPDVIGYQQELAERLIVAAGLAVAGIDTATAPQERGVVVNTRPPAGRSRAPGEGVTLFVSVGAPTISVPDLAGLTLDEARELLELSGLALGSTQARTSSAAEPGLIIEQNPAAGTLAAPGAAVRVTIVRGGIQ
ncbi:MAG: PASTA domain-containing protein [Gemmatimonadota bacterium]|nr:MAG: PASTA domain-containing protein [Gemmatimonadota bacterium]